MASLLTTVALCAGVAFAAALPASDSPANSTLEANSTVTACSTVTSTQTLPWQNTVVETVTFNNTNTPEYTRLVSSYEATVTSSVAGYGTNTSTITVPGSTTLTKPVSTEFVASACTSTITESAESTSTVYTGSYSSAVETHCPTATVNTIHYLQGEITETHTSTDYPDPTYVTKFIPAGTTTVLEWASERTKTITSWATNSDVVSATRNGSCTTTVWTATAASATTQSAKCAPTNLITDVESFEQGDGYTQSAVRGYGLSAWKDASSCCQQCVENGDECAAMSFTTTSQGGQCVLLQPSQESGAPAPHDIALVITKAKPDTGFQHGVVASGQKVIQSEN